jgi:hypothetical protein
LNWKEVGGGIVEFLIVWGRNEARAGPAQANTHTHGKNSDLINFLLRKENNPKQIVVPSCKHQALKMLWEALLSCK